MRRTSAACDQDLIRAHLKRRLVADNFDRVRVDEARVPFHRGYVIAPQLRFDHIDLARHYAIRAEDQILHVYAVFKDVALPIKRPLPKAAEIQHSLAQGLARNRPGVNAHAADRSLAIDDSDFPPQLRGTDSAFLPSGTAANDDQVIFVGIHTVWSK